MLATALVVEQDQVLRAQIARWVRAEGFAVLECGGPQDVDAYCPGGKETCPLAANADIVVLDVSLSDDDVCEGPAGWQLVYAYLDAGKAVVALADSGAFPHPPTNDGFIVIPRPPERTRLIEALRSSTLLPAADEAEETRIEGLAVVRHRRPAPLARR